MITSPTRSLMLFSSVSSFSTEDGPAALALQMCEQLDAKLTAVLLDLLASVPYRHDGEPSGGGEGAIARNASALAETARQRGIDARVVTTLEHSFGVGGCLSDRLRFHDLAIIGAGRDGLLSERQLAEHLIFDSGRPVLVVPARLARPFVPNRVVVAWDNTQPATRALNDALAVFGTAAEYVLLTIGDDKDIVSSLGWDDIESALGRRGFRFTSEQRNRGDDPVGDAIQQAAQELAGDVLVMGGYAHSRLRDIVLGSATTQILDRPRLPVLISH